MEKNMLQSRILELEAENKYLKSLLDKAGIVYTFPNTSDITTHYEEFDPNQGDRIIPLEITHGYVRRYYSYFWGRMDVFSKRYQNKNTGKAGYFPQCDNFWRRGVCPKVGGNRVKCKDCNYRAWTKLEASNIEAHLRGSNEDASDVIGVYPLFPDGTCRFLVFDFDNHSRGAEQNDFANTDDAWREEVESVREICRLNDIPVLVERSRSGNGAHIWIFFDIAIPAVLARRFGYALLDRGAESVNLKSFHYYDRMLPAQSELADGELGNLIALPLQGQALKVGNSAFIDANWNAIPNQWEALFATKKLSQQNIENLLSEWSETEGSIDTKFPADDTKPWDRKSAFERTDVDGVMNIVLANQIFISSENLKPRIQNQIRRLAAFSNPAFFKNNAMGLSNYDQPRYIYLGEDDNGYICIPRGLLDKLQEKCQESGIIIQIEDRRSNGHSINVCFTGEMRTNQKAAIRELLKHDCGILSAATAFGKTVTCSGIIVEKKVSTLILLESSALVEQWENALNTFLKIDEDLPEYRTKTGRIKRRKSVIGLIQGPKDTSTGIIDIAMAGSLFKKGEPHSRLREYGMVLVDDCEIIGLHRKAA